MLSAGLLRARGLPSASAMLPVCDVNAEVVALARRDVVPAVGGAAPVLAGLSAAEPVARHLDGLAAGGIAGVANFPSAVHLSGAVRAAMESAGAGFGAEVEMLGAARARGLATFAYVKTLEEAERAAGAAPDLICLNFGWNAGGRLSAMVPDVSMTEAMLRARRIVRRLARIAPRTRVVIEGGPVVNPVQVAEICTEAGASGYVGGSTLDRLPVEDAVYERTLAFKSAGGLRRRRRAPEGGVARAARAAGIVGESAALARALEALRAAEGAGGPIVISGGPGTQRHAAARAVLPPGAGALATEELSEVELGARLFGRAERPGLLERHDGDALLIETPEGLGARWQRKLARYVSRGEATPIGGGRVLRPRTRLVMIASAPLAVLAARGRIDASLAEVLAGREVAMPGLGERAQDLPALIDDLLAREEARFTFSSPALGALLRTPWPGGVGELRAVIGALAARGATGELRLAEVEPLLAAAAPADGAADAAAAEREWILDMLRRNGFARARTAAAMGVSRRTLYARMRRHGL